MPSAAASRLDPRFGMRVLGTPHFRIYFHQGEEPLARRLALIAESVWSSVGGAFGVEAPQRTHVIVADQTALANGWATPLPYNTIFVTAAAPAGSEFIGHTDDWLRLVFTHEFTHIVHLDRSLGWARFVRGAFGRNPVAFPNLFLPGWAVEGIAVWEESALTSAGRRSGGDFRAIEHEAGRAGRLDPLDRINGGLIDWPAGSAEYAYGTGFHEYLAQRFGEDSFAHLYAGTARRLPFFGSGAFTRVYGQPLGALYREYQDTIRAQPAAHPPRTIARRVTRHGFVALGPRFAPAATAGEPPEIWYSLRDPHGLPALRAVTTDGEHDRRLATRYLGSTLAATRDLAVFDEQEVRRNSAVHSDLRLLDRRSGRVRPLTREERLRDPDLSPDGRTIVAVRESLGRRDLVRLPFASGEVGPIETIVTAAETRFDAPRWSPDGRTIVTARQVPGRLSEVVMVDAATHDLRVLASAPGTRFVTPAWRPDGNAIVLAADFDGGPFDLYELPVDQPAVLRRLTTTAGAIWPDVSPDGQSLVYAGYTDDGFDVFTTRYPVDEGDTRRLLMVPPAADNDDRRGNTDGRGEPGNAVGSASATPDDAADPAARSYRPYRTLAPTSWNPVMDTGHGLRAGVNVTGTDVLARHAYSASATWLAARPATTVAPETNLPDWQVSYAYDRWRPILFASAGRSTSFSTSAAQQPLTRQSLDLQAGVLFPVRHVRTTRRLLASVIRTVDRFTPVAAAVARQERTALRFAGAFSSAQVFGYSVSAERGVSAGTTVELARRSLGSDTEATTVTGDVRAYIPGLRRHQVLALRAAGGRVAQASPPVRALLLGGASASTDVIDFSQDAVGLMRGLPARALAGSRVLSLNADYRFPIAWPQRGRGTWPFFLRTLHGALFADAGSAWTGERPRAFHSAAGAELSGDLVLGYTYPLTVASGVAWGRDHESGRGRVTAYLRIGRAF